MYAQLLRKELRLQRAALFFTLAIILVWGLLITLPQFVPDKAFGPNISVKDIAQFAYWIFFRFCLLAIVPCILGATIVADERKFGMLDWQLSLPISRKKLLLFKVLVATVLTLLIVGIIQPMLDFVTMRVLGEMFQLPRWLISLEVYFGLPLMLLFCSAYTSTLSTEAGKAFYGSVLIFLFLLACTWLPDPNGLMLIRLNHNAHGSWLVITSYLPLLVGVLCLALGLLAWRNFRYETTRWRRVFGQMAVMAILTIVATTLALRWQMSPMGMLTQNPSDVTPLIEKTRTTPVDWHGIRPLAVKTSNPSPLIGRKRYAAFMETNAIREVHALPKRDLLVLTMDTLSAADNWINRSPAMQTVFLDMKSKRLTPLYQMASLSFDFISMGKGEAAYIGNSLVASRRPVRVFTDVPRSSSFLPGLFAYFTMGKSVSFEFVDEMYRLPSPIIIQGKTLDPSYLNLIYSAKGYYLYQTKETSTPGPSSRTTTMLLRYQQDKGWSLVRDNAGHEIHMSTDGHWYSTQLKTNSYTPRVTSLTIHSADSETTWTIGHDGKEIILCFNQSLRASDYRYNGQNATQFSVLATSPDGRFLPYLLVSSQNDKNIPDNTLELRALDLTSGESIGIATAIPEQVDTHAVTTESFWNGWSRISTPRGKDRLYVGVNRDASFDFEYPALAWSPNKDQLALLINDHLQVFDYAKGKGFLRSSERDLSGFQLAHLDYWDDHTLLAWGDLGLFEIAE